MSAAYYLAFTDLRRRLQDGELAPDDLVFTVDADGQHELAVLDELQRITQDERLDALLVRRDLSTYPRYKQLGNGLMSRWATLWASGVQLLDVESGYRIFRLGPLADALDYYRGYKYSETVEVAVVLSRLGYDVRNDVLVPVPVFRSRTRMKDVVIDLVADPARRALRVAAPPVRGRGGPERSAVVEVAGSAEQVVETHRREPACLQPVEDAGQRRDDTERSAVIRPSSPSCRRMIEPGRARRSTRLATSAGSSVAQSPADTSPRHRGHAPLVHGQADEGRALAVGRPVEAGADAELAGEGVLRAAELRVAGVEPTPLVVVVRVVAEQHPVLVERAGDVRPRVERLADEEERRLHPVLVEDVAHGERGRVVRPVVERDGDAVVAGTVGDHGAEPRQLGVVGARPAEQRRGHDEEGDRREPAAAARAAGARAPGRRRARPRRRRPW